MEKHNYGQYLCRIELGNSKHRLEMFAWLHSAEDEAKKTSIVLPILLALLAAMFTISAFIVIRYGSKWWSENVRKNKYNNQCAHLRENHDDNGV